MKTYKSLLEIILKYTFILVSGKIYLTPFTHTFEGGKHKKNAATINYMVNYMFGTQIIVKCSIWYIKFKMHN